MLTINIIPIELKKEIKLGNIAKLMNRSMLVLLFFAIVFSSVIYVSKIILEIHLSGMQKQNILSSQNAEYSDKIKAIENQIIQADEIQKKNDLDYVAMLSVLTGMIGANITVNQLSVDKSKNMITISGIAKDRDDLLSLKANFENNKNFSGIQLPIQSLLQKNDIDFSINANIISYDFK